MAEDERFEFIWIHTTFLEDIRNLFFNSKSGNTLAEHIYHVWNMILPVSPAAKIKHNLGSRWVLDVKCDGRKIEPIY